MPRFGIYGILLSALMLVSFSFAQRPPASQPATAPAAPVDYTKLKELLPSQALGINRSTHEGENTSLGAMVLSRGNAEYAKPNAGEKDPHASIEITDFAATPQMLAGMTVWRTIPMKVENDQGFQKTATFRNNPAFQIYTKEGESRQMLVVVAERYLVNIQTNFVNEADFTSLIEGLPWDRLAALK